MVMRKDKEGKGIDLIDEGEIDKGILNGIGKSKNGYDELEKIGILYAEWFEPEEFFIKT
jgi:hypothetical protein